MEPINIKFPVLIIQGFETFEVLKSESLFTTTNALGLKKGVLLNNEIIDSGGTIYQVESVKKMKNINPFWKFEFFNPLIKVEIKVKETKNSIDLDNLKKRLMKIINKDIEFWDSDERLSAIIDESQSIKILISNLCEEFYNA